MDIGESEYKIPFIIHRIFQTFFGGFEFSSKTTPIEYKPYSSNRKLFIYLFLSFIGIIFSILIDNQMIDSYIGILCSSIIGFFFTLMMNMIPQISSKSNNNNPLWSPNLSTTKQKHIFPLKIKYNSALLILTRSLVASSLIGMMTNTFKLKQIKIHIQTGNFLTLCIMFLVWFTFTTAQYSLTIGSPTETTIYSMRIQKIDCLNRSVYMLFVLIPITIIPSHLYPIGTLIICCLPFMWILGILPPIIVLLHYSLEQINIILLAGTANCFIWPLLVTVTVSITVILLSHFYLDSNQFILINLMTGFLISNKWYLNLKYQFHHSAYLLKIISIISIIAINFFPINIDIQNQLFNSLLGVLSMIYIVKYIKLIYIWNIVKNPFNIIMSIKLFKRIHSSRIFFLTIRILSHFCLPVLCLTLIVNKSSRERIHLRAGKLIPEHFLMNVLVFRIFRQTWQYPQSMGFQVIIIQIIDHLRPNHFVNRWPLEAKYLALDLAFNFITNFFKKLYLVLIILVSSVAIRKQKVRYSWIIFVFNMIFVPVNFLIIIISSILNAPILPLFTLPIFLPSFPRPLKFWPTMPTIPMIDMNDAVYYKQLMPRLIDALHKKSLFWDFRRAGEILIARFDDRLIWFQVLESGNNYVQVQMKGLELQETSCHTIEALTIDQIIEHSFHWSWFDNFLNKHLLYAINPMMKVSTKTYSDAKSILTGIIDSPETYAKIKSLFCQVFIWVLLQKKISSIMEQRKNNEIDTSIMVKKSQINIIFRSEEDISTSSSSMPSDQFSYEDLQPDWKWSNVSYQYSRRKSINRIFSQWIDSIEWFQEVLKVLTNNQLKLNENELQSLTLTYNHITNVYFSIVFPVTHIEASMAQSIYELFNGQISKDVIDEKLFLIPDLHQVCIKSFQYTTKIVLDQTIFIKENLSDDILISTLQDFDHNWLFGTANSAEWKEAIINEKSFLFSISKNAAKENYQSHLLTLKDIDVYMCSLNRAIVEAIWSSLSFELFYLTNDDEERYSIQAHPIIFRNLTVQAADPPLGYPVYISEPVLITHIS